MKEIIELKGLETKYLGRNFLYFEEISSTNDFLKENAAAYPNGTACAAAFQLNGKGRLGRTWNDKKGSALTFSFLLHDIKPEKMSALPLVVGLGVSRAIEKLCGVRVDIKWSNDVLINSQKLCGILCESRIQGDKSFAIVGIGVNLAYTRAELDELDLLYATSLLLATNKKFNEMDIAAAILNELEAMLEKYISEGLDVFRDDYKKHCVTLGRDVLLVSGEEKTVAYATDISANGGLVCDICGAMRTINAGDVSVRGLYGYN